MINLNVLETAGKLLSVYSGKDIFLKRYFKNPEEKSTTVFGFSTKSGLLIKGSNSLAGVCVQKYNFIAYLIYWMNEDNWGANVDYNDHEGPFGFKVLGCHRPEFSPQIYNEINYKDIYHTLVPLIGSLAKAMGQDMPKVKLDFYEKSNVITCKPDGHGGTDSIPLSSEYEVLEFMGQTFEQNKAHSSSCPSPIGILSQCLTVTLQLVLDGYKTLNVLRGNEIPF